MARPLALFFTMLAPLVAIQRADAQYGRGRDSQESDWWTSVQVGLFQPQAVTDGSTQSNWQFANTVQWRATLEKTIQPGNTLGVAATFAQAPLTYSTFGFAPGASTCASCDADASITQVMATFHAGGARQGFHQVIELGIGTTIYSNFKERDNGQQLDPKSNADLAFAISYGFGYALNSWMHLNVVEDLSASIHSHDNLPAGTNTVSRQYTTRLGVRVGL